MKNHSSVQKLSIGLLLMLVGGLFIYLFFVNRPSAEMNKGCTRLHLGEVNVDVSYSSGFLYPKIGPDKAHVPLYKVADRDTATQDSLFVINVSEARGTYGSAESLLTIGDMVGPKFTEVVSFNGLSAALATPGPGFYYYLIPFGNRVVAIDYLTKDLSPEEKTQADKVLRNIKITSASTDVGVTPKVEQCR